MLSSSFSFSNLYQENIFTNVNRDVKCSSARQTYLQFTDPIYRPFPTYGSLTDVKLLTDLCEMVMVHTHQCEGDGEDRASGVPWPPGLLWALGGGAEHAPAGL